MIRTKEMVMVGVKTKEGEKFIQEEMTVIDGLGIRQIGGNKYYSITIARGKKQGWALAFTDWFYDAADYARILIQNYPDLFNWIDSEKPDDYVKVINAARTTQFILSCHFGTQVELPFGNFNHQLKKELEG